MYRLINPHENDISVVMYKLIKKKGKAVVFNYLVNRYMLTAAAQWF
jgi:hypothetical protein